MRYAILLRPHANARYQEAVKTLAEKELMLTLKHSGIEVCGEGVRTCDILGTDVCVFDADSLYENEVADIRRHSSLQLLCEYREDGSLLPLSGACEAEFGDDLPAILKYKGKTNERFTSFLIRMAELSVRKTPVNGVRLRFIDPMCGKGTAVFEALNMGMDACGSDASAAAIDEGVMFFRKYLEYHRIKHTNKESSMTLPQGRGVPVKTVQAKDKGEARFAVCDASQAAYVFGRGKADIMSADLPYGVQHGPSEKGHGGSISDVLDRMLEGASKALVQGGAVSFAFNTNTLSRHKALAAIKNSGLTVCEGAEYEGLEHWVEQAVTRDVCVAVKE